MYAVVLFSQGKDNPKVDGRGRKMFLNTHSYSYLWNNLNWDCSGAGNRAGAMEEASLQGVWQLVRRLARWEADHYNIHCAQQGQGAEPTRGH